jgi:predicted DNA-binding WGR domain protein
MSLDHLQLYWAAINQAIAPIAETIVFANVRKVQFTNTAKWGPVRKSEIFIRPCYDQTIDLLYEMVNNAPELAFGFVEGSSGIGKTVWIFYFIYRVVRANIEAQPKPTFVYQDPFGANFYFYYDNTGVPVVCKGSPQDRDPDYFISDTFPREAAAAKKLQVHVASAGNPDKKWKNFLKDQDHKLIRVFPPFSREEHLLCYGIQVGGVWTNQEELQLRYDIFGGCLRLMHEENSDIEVLDDLYEIALRELQSLFEDVKANDGMPILQRFIAVIQGSAKTIATELESAVPKLTVAAVGTAEQSKLRTLFRHLVVGENGKKAYIPSSQFMEFFGAVLVEKQEQGIWTIIQQIFERTGAGTYFEKCAHEAVIKQLKLDGLRVAKITENKTITKLNGVDVPPLRRNIIRKVLIRSWADIALLQPNEYGFPIVPNFPLVDAVVVGAAPDEHIAFQMTIREETHSSRAVDRENDFYGMFPKDGRKIKMVNVLHHSNYTRFYADPNLPPIRWEQYKAYGQPHAFSTKTKAPNTKAEASTSRTRGGLKNATKVDGPEAGEKPEGEGGESAELEGEHDNEDTMGELGKKRKTRAKSGTDTKSAKTSTTTNPSSSSCSSSSRKSSYLEDNSNKFYELTLSEMTVTRRSGKIGTRGKKESFEFGSVEDAGSFFAEALDEIQKNGYREL